MTLVVAGVSCRHAYEASWGARVADIAPGASGCAVRHPLERQRQGRDQSWCARSQLQLAASDAPLTRALDPERAREQDLAPLQLNESGFRLALNEDAMATEKLAEGIRAFAADAVKLEQLMLAA